VAAYATPVAPGIGAPLRRHWLPLGALEIRVTPPPTQNVIEPTLEIEGVAGVALTVTLVVPVAEVQPLSVTFTEYVPLIDVVAFAIVGFCSVEVNPFGPVHAYVAPVTAGVISAIVPPVQNGPLFDGVGVAGVAFTTTVVVPAAEVQPLLVSVTE